MRYLLLTLPFLMAAAPTPEMLEQPGGIKCKFFDKELNLVEEKMFYWHQLIDLENGKMVFRAGDNIYTIRDGDPNPWICVPVR